MNRKQRSREGEYKREEERGGTEKREGERNRKKICVVSFYNGISNFMGYLVINPSFYKEVVVVVLSKFLK